MPSGAENFQNLKAVQTKIFLWLGLSVLSIFFVLQAKAKTQAVWIRPLIGASFEVRKDEAKTRAVVASELASIKRARLNTIFAETFRDGYTIFPSRFGYDGVGFFAAQLLTDDWIDQPGKQN